MHADKEAKRLEYTHYAKRTWVNDTHVQSHTASVLPLFTGSEILLIFYSGASSTVNKTSVYKLDDDDRQFTTIKDEID